MAFIAALALVVIDEETRRSREREARKMMELDRKKRKKRLKED